MKQDKTFIIMVCVSMMMYAISLTAMLSSNTSTGIPEGVHFYIPLDEPNINWADSVQTDWNINSVIIDTMPYTGRTSWIQCSYEDYIAWEKSHKKY